MKMACIILNYNDAEMTCKAVEVARATNEYECIIVVDNCSRDQDYNKLIGLQNKDTILIRSNKNGGYGSGNKLRFKICDRACWSFYWTKKPEFYC